ncbi:MAG: PLP-dependent transferase [Opitutales bacterium]
MPDYPIGSQIPDSPHAMCVSLPDMHAVIGYEEKDPVVMKAVQSGYPRFVTHRYILKLVEHFKQELDLEDFDIFLVNSVQALASLSAYVDCSNSSTGSMHGVFYYICPQRDDLRKRAFQLMQHTGYGISSRLAERILNQLGLLENSALFEEERLDGDSYSAVSNAVAALANTEADKVVLTNSGMNAFYAAFKAAEATQAREGKHVWIQLGWLYLDTNKVLERLSSTDTRFITCYDVDARDTLDAVLEKYGKRVAGIITETPTNPLVQTVNIQYLRKVCDNVGALLILDPTIASLSNVDVSQYADIIVTSLTKYAGNQGDVIMGALTSGIERPWSEFWLEDAKEFVEPPHFTDCGRMAAQISDWQSTSEKINANTRQLAEFLNKHKAVSRVFWAESLDYLSQFKKIRKPEGGPGSILTLYLKRPENMDAFYAALSIAKGPSFGTTFTMACPFMYLAHYDLVSNEEGRDYTWSHGLDPDLIRVSVGAEPISEIIEAFEKALSAAL